MPQLSGIYDSGPIAPVAKIKENLALLTGGAWEYYNIKYIEGMPRSSPLIAEMVTLSGATILAANGVIQKLGLGFLQLSTGELLHLRWEPLENVEGILWQQPGQGKFQTGFVQARVDKLTKLYDPYLASSTFFILGVGQGRNMNLEVRNPMGYATPLARFAFWGFRYVLDAYNFKDQDKTVQEKLKQGDKETAQKALGPLTWVPTEWKSA